MLQVNRCILAILAKRINGAIDPEDPNIAIQILDEIAARAGFSCRNTYGVAEGPKGKETWTELLFWVSMYMM